MQKNKEKVLEEYRNYKRVSIEKEDNVKIVCYFIEQFILSSKKKLNDFQEKDLINFVNSLNKKYSIGSINDIKVHVKSFIKWYFSDYSIRFRNLDKICQTRKKEKTYSPDQMLNKKDIEKLVQSENETRWKAFWLLYFYGGFRPSEVCHLKWEDITFSNDGAFVKVYVKKNGKSFEKFIPNDVCFYLKKLQHNNSKYVFPTKRTNKKGVSVGDMPMTRSGVYQRLRDRSKIVFGKHVNPYILRHSIATILYNRDDIKDDDTAQQMGHSTSMKQVYSNLDIDKIRKRMKRIWINPEELPPETKEQLVKDVKKLYEISAEHEKLFQNLKEQYNLNEKLQNELIRKIK